MEKPSDNIQEIPLSGEYIELFKLLKLLDIAESGGEAKLLVGEGMVRVNGDVETRKRRKLVRGDQVECRGAFLKLT
jgi:ribosome-associated protein